MKLETTLEFVKSYKNLPPLIQKRTDEKLLLLLANPQHTSLHIKKIKGGGEEIWEGRISKNYRFTFKIKGDVFVLRKIGTHDLLRRP